MQHHPIRQKIKHPETGAVLDDLFVTDTGWFTWDAVLSAYRHQQDFHPLTKGESLEIDFTKTKLPTPFPS